MTPENQRIAIAETLGWERMLWHIWNAPDGRKHENWAGELACPDYPADWNTRPEMLAHIAVRGLQRHLVHNIRVLTGVTYKDDSSWDDPVDPWGMLSVPQDTFCRAFLETLNLWKP